MIPEETVGKILDAAQIVDVVGDFVTLKRRGANYVACCPFHNEKTPSFYVSPSKGIFKCFGCGKSGTAVGFVMEHESLTYTEALKWLAAKYHIEVKEKEETAEDIARRQKGESLMLVSDFAGKFFVSCLSSEEGKALGNAYFKSRGLEDGTIRKFGLGWAPTDRHALLNAALKAGYRQEYLVETGLCVQRDDGSVYDRFADRVIFPIHSVSGRIIAFGGRTLRSDKTVAKYVNSPESEIYNKSRSLYGIWFAKNEISRRDRCILVEGYLDVISMHQLGITNVVASSGTSLTTEQVRLIKKFTDNITIIYDGDSAGIKAALRGIGLVLKEGMNVKVVLLPDGDDPDSYSRKHTLDEVRDYLETHERDFIDFKTDILLDDAGDDPIKKADLINDIADTVALVPDAVKRAMYVEKCSERFRIDRRILFDRIKDTRGEMLVAERRQEQNRRMRKEMVQTMDQGPEKRPEGSAAAHEHGPHLENPFLAPCEKELLGFIVEHGQSPLEFDRDSEFHVDGTPDTVAEFIDNNLAGDSVTFSNSVYRKVYDKYFELYDAGLTQKQISDRLLNSDDKEIAATASELLVDKYVITVEDYRNALTSTGTQLVIFVPKSLLAYQSRRLDMMMKDLSDRLAAAGDNVEEQMAVLEQMNRLNKTRSVINNKLGRV